MMAPSTLLLLLLLYPVACLVTPRFLFQLWPQMQPPASDPRSAINEQGRVLLARLGVFIPLSIYVILAVGTLAWLVFLSADSGESVFSANKWLSGSLIGMYLGTAWAGVSIWLLALGASTGRMRREIPGMMASVKFQSVVWLVGAFAEEMWRVVAILAFLKSGSSPAFSVIVVSVAYCSGYLTLGPQRVAAAALDGAFFGFLYFWRGSFLAPFVAHLAVQAVYIWGVSQLSVNRHVRKTWQIPGTRCPVCQESLGLLQIKLKEVFECPFCKATLSVSDVYQELMRFGGAFVFLLVLFCSIVLLTFWLPYYLGVLLTYPVTLGVMTSGFLLYQRTFVRLFPPRLQRGTPYFIRLNLGSRRESKGNNTETDESIGVPPRTPE
ncbi:MAG: CPBP family intramembrane metalloprotease [Acidobacteria bacterium]|nr:CPBP family intramembrane metalloprotease [Acidobacteriota bacterium]